MIAKLQASTITRQAYLIRARNWIRKTFNALRSDRNGDYYYCHPSHVVAYAMKLAEKQYPDLSSFGVEGSESPSMLFLNMGETYESTIVWHKNRFCVCSWGDIAESYSNSNSNSNS